MEAKVIPKKKVNIMLPADLVEDIGHRALSEGRGHRPSLVIEDACREYLKNRPARPTSTATTTAAS